MQKITPHLWFDDNAEEAVNFYMSVFKEGKILSTVRYDETVAQVAGRPTGSVMSIEFELFGQRFMAINGGPIFKFNESVSFMVDCKDQAEIDYYWEKLSAVPESEQCGWLKDKYGLSWQIVPAALTEIMSGGDEAKKKRAMNALMNMKKLDIEGLMQA